jgi:hypothetical protein
MSSDRTDIIASVQADISKLEARILRAGKTIKELLETANVDGSLWWRWRTGHLEPRRSTWRRVEAAADKLAPRRGR